MKKQSFLQLITLFFSLTLACEAFAIENFTAAEAEKWANHKGEEILNILSSKNLETKYAALDKILAEDIDLDHAAHFVVGKYWKIMTPQQKESYVPLFKRYVSGLYKGYSLDFAKDDIQYSVGRVVPTKSTMEVWCNIKLKKLENNVDENSQGGFDVLFVLVKNKQNIQVQDLKISESSLLLSFRDRFYKMIHIDNDDEIDWFLEDLATIVNDNEQKNAQNLEFGNF